MNLLYKTRQQPITLLIEVATNGPQKIGVVVQDANKKNTKYTNRWSTITGRGKFYVRMPISPYEALVSVYNKAHGNQRRGEDNTFKIINIEAVPLKRKMDCVDWDNKKIKDFVRFSQQFSENCGVLSAGKFPNGSTYISDEGNFRIDYFDDIRSKRGMVIPTPARISQSKGIIQVSKEHFKKFTVPMRMAILLHEFSHFYLNKDMKDEEHENASMFAWQLMAIDVQEVTEKNLEEIVFRLLFLDRMGFGSLVQKHAKRPDGSKAWMDSLEL